MTLTRATIAHAPILAEIHATAFPPHDVWGEAALATQLALPGVFGWLCEAGFVLARVAADEAEILTLAVVPSARRAGVGRTLLTAAQDEAGRLGAARIFLEVAEDNLPARRLYAASGYGEVGRRRRYYGAIDALVLSQRLDCGHPSRE